MRFGKGIQGEGTVEGCSLLSHPRAAVLGNITGFGLGRGCPLVPLGRGVGQSCSWGAGGPESPVRAWNGPGRALPAWRAGRMQCLPEQAACGSVLGSSHARVPYPPSQVSPVICSISPSVDKAFILSPHSLPLFPNSCHRKEKRNHRVGVKNRHEILLQSVQPWAGRWQATLGRC